MAQRLAGCVLVAAATFLTGGCKERSDKPIAGLLAAGAPVMRVVGKEQRPVSIGSQLLPDTELVATGPAVIEYFGGGLRMLEKGDELEVGEAEEAKLLGSNLPPRRWVEGEAREAPSVQRIVAARYTNIQVTPESTLQNGYTDGQYIVAFFTPNGIQNLGNGANVDGPRQPLPAPPHRPRVPYIHAGPLGEGGLIATVTDGFAVAETDDLATAVLLEDRKVPLGRTVRLIIPEDAEVELQDAQGKVTEVEGPVDLRLR